MEGRRRQPEEAPPRRRALGSWLFGTAAGLVALAFLAVVIVVLVIVLVT